MKSKISEYLKKQLMGKKRLFFLCLVLLASFGCRKSDTGPAISVYINLDACSKTPKDTVYVN
jgi:hypothetical protein